MHTDIPTAATYTAYYYTGNVWTQSLLDLPARLCPASGSALPTRILGRGSTTDHRLPATGNQRQTETRNRKSNASFPIDSTKPSKNVAIWGIKFPRRPFLLKTHMFIDEQSHNLLDFIIACEK